MKIVERNAWANLLRGIEFSDSDFYPPRDLWAVQTIDDKIEGEDFMHFGSKEHCLRLFRREISIEEFYES